MAISIGDTFGAGLIGAIITSALYGVTTVQTYLYFVNYPKDSSKLKSLVSLVWLLDTVHLALVSLCIYHYLVINYNNIRGLTDIHWSLSLSLVFNLLLSVIVQSFFTAQVYTISRGKVRWILTPLLVILVLAHFVFGIITSGFFFAEGTFAAFQQSETVKLVAATPFAIFAVLSDIVIAASLCVLLHDGRTGIGRTNMLITTLMIYAVNRCILTSVVAITEVLVFVSTPGTLWFIAIDFVIGKLYANSFLASLNSRNALRAQNSSNSNMYISAEASSRGGGPQGQTVVALKAIQKNNDGLISGDGETSFGSSGPKVQDDVFRA